jgi:FkbM family methyltransferase
MKSISQTIKRILGYPLRKQVYTARAGLVTGLKRRGGLGFFPKPLTKEYIFLKSLNYKGKNVYDVGGYFGLMTIFFAREVGENGTVTTFEPNPDNYEVIIDHLQLNNFRNAKVICIGLGKQPEKLKFVVDDKQPAKGTAQPALQEHFLKEKTSRILEIEVDTLDSQMAHHNLPVPHFIKIDVEGLELEVLQGMTQTISRYKPDLFIELHGQNKLELIDFQLSHDYNIHQVEQSINITQANKELARQHLYASSLPLANVNAT